LFENIGRIPQWVAKSSFLGYNVKDNVILWGRMSKNEEVLVYNDFYNFVCFDRVPEQAGSRAATDGVSYKPAKYNVNSGGNKYPKSNGYTDTKSDEYTNPNQYPNAYANKYTYTYAYSGSGGRYYDDR